MLMVHLTLHTVVVTVVFDWHLGKVHGSKMHVMLPPKQLSLFSPPLKRDSKGGRDRVPFDIGGHAKI